MDSYREIEQEKYNNKIILDFFGTKYFPFWDSFRQKNAIFNFKNKDLELRINPLFNFTVYKNLSDSIIENENKNLYINTRGFNIEGKLSKKISFYSNFLENQAFFPLYIENQIDSLNVIPGQGERKDYKEGGHDWAMARGAISFIPIKKLTISLGNDKIFLGRGMQSMIISNNSFSHPFAKVDYYIYFKNCSRLNISNTYALLQTLGNGYVLYNDRQFSNYILNTIQYNYYPNEETIDINLGICQANIFKKEKFYHQMISAFANLKLINNFVVYSQISKIEKNNAYQIGIQAINLLEYCHINGLRFSFCLEMDYIKERQTIFVNHSQSILGGDYFGKSYNAFAKLEYKRFYSSIYMQNQKEENKKYQDIEIGFYANKKNDWRIFLGYHKQENQKYLSLGTRLLIDDIWR